MKSVHACIVLLALGACGGGGGGGGATPTPTTPTPAPPSTSTPIVINPGDPIPTNFTGPVILTGTAIESAFGSTGGFGAFSAPVAATIQSSANTSGNLTAGPDSVTLTANGESVVIDLRTSASSSDVTFDGSVFRITTASGSFLIQPQELVTQPMAFSSFGGWAKTSGSGQNPNGTDAIRFGVFGSQTPQGSVPTGSATYTGESIGLANVTTGSQAIIGFTNSDVTISTPDFNTVTFTSANTTFSSLNASTLTNPGDLNFEATGTVSGTGFSATPTNPGRSGRVDGQFFGPAAEEVGGTFGITGSNIVYGGAFGGKKQ
ncbi:hypothetical protein DKT77_14485 [Meridianimarinicoccus roseus]|uniref:Transferrin-binding protein B C-lobe/N-lobe beta-barrel domain-containing protein n=1 Tax=Meridianimarinicoccus roseus TaxID=2072018 RepID=A0A2V2L988_9RHOB|nr:transferrin-binding protein-like solute binding protein [Meridianimarinicoccus roseus]PWR01805.1 hypothetical protein DKT77_14485 [Meridianimarinicoccus roseus]